jgi:glycyl-tRNA synthetase beta chain
MTENIQPDTAPALPILIFEIGTEEVPARFLPDAMVQLKENTERLFTDYRLRSGTLKTYSTPRRLSLIAEVERSQTAVQKEVWGPPENAAFDKEGRPTKAAEAFAKSQGIEISDISVREKGKGRYVVTTVTESSRKTSEILSEILPKLLEALHFPKAMRWGDGSFKFVRPIHWILSIYDNQKVQFEIEGINSGNITRGHRFLSPASFEIKDAKSYINLLRNNFVILDPAERKKIIAEGARKLASSVNASVIEDEGLLNHITFLVECPVPVLGGFSPDYLDLPKELLITVMKDHQKYFALENGNGALANYFVVVSNTRQENAETVRKGAEKVIKARFEDARFYYEDDKKVTLMERLEGLKKVVFHDRLGSTHDKSMRIASVADFLADRCRPSRKEEIHTAALLSKSDLISGVVREFPELQGIMGGYYARHEEYKKEIVQAIREQYLPGYSGDSLPESHTGAIVSLADKLDNIASFFMLGLVPTGTEDPFALRRQTIGTILILVDKKYDISLDELINAALKPYSIDDRPGVINSIVRFFEQRFDPIFQSAGFSTDMISAVVPFVRNMPFHIIRDRLEALNQLRQDAGCEGFLLIIKRINNIAPKAAVPPVNTRLLVQEEEKSLHAAIEKIAPQIASVLQTNEPTEAIRLLMSLREPVNLFFDKVLIMDKDEAIKQNRLSLIKTIQSIGLQIADFSKLG